jgi:hypothetical protein
MALTSLQHCEPSGVAGLSNVRKLKLRCGCGVANFERNFVEAETESRLAEQKVTNKDWN